MIVIQDEEAKSLGFSLSNLSVLTPFFEIRHQHK